MNQKKKRQTSINDYLEIVKETDRLPITDRSPVLQGLFGEVGGILAVLKKKKREPKSAIGLDAVLVEELGDVFWYFTCLTFRLGMDTGKIYTDYTKINSSGSGGKRVSRATSIMQMSSTKELQLDLQGELAKLGQMTGNFLSLEYLNNNPEHKIIEFLSTYFSIVRELGVDFEKVVARNINKVSSRFTRPPNSKLPTFDNGFPEFERLPGHFEIEFVNRAQGQQAMRWNGVFIGDPLSDSIGISDGYRFHDVFHFAHAAILHWSPTFRALIKHKRKSDPQIDRDQDGGRAIVVEEGLSAWIFNIAKQNDYFDGYNDLPFDMLKNIANIVQGFEVEDCPFVLWEETILNGYQVFRKVVQNEGGRVIGDRKARTLTYKAK